MNRRKTLRQACLGGGLSLLFAGAVALAVTAPSEPPEAAAAEPGGGVITGTVTTKPSKYRSGVVVHLEKVAGTFRPPKKPVIMDQKGMKFVPHVMAVVRGTTVKFLNNDGVRHNVFSPDGEKYDLGTWPAGEARTYTFKRIGVYTQLCNVHPEMLAYIVVVENPYFAVTDDSGAYRIEGVPAGSYKIRAWSEKLRESTASVSVAASGTATANFSLKK